MDSALAQSLVHRYGAPLYAYDLAAVAENVERLQGCLPPHAELFYSLKANPLPALVSEVRAKGCRAEITSVGELAAALEAGFQGRDLLAGGPAKSVGFLRQTLSAGVIHFSCESFSDLARLSAVCDERDVEANVLLRMNPAEAPNARLAMSGVDSQFGFSESLLMDKGARGRISLPRLRIFGVHVYYGTQVAGVDALATNTRRALECARRVSEALGFECAIVNAGGGFPWAYAHAAEPPDLSSLRDALLSVTTDCALGGQARLWFEAGRYLVAGAGCLVAQVMEIKYLPTRTFVLLDSGIHHLGGMAGLGRVPRAAISLMNLSRPANEAPLMTVDLMGPLCTPLDCLGRNLTIPMVEEGDLIAIPNVGAYGLTASLTSFLSHPPPVEIAHRRGQAAAAFQWRTGHGPLAIS